MIAAAIRGTGLQLSLDFLLHALPASLWTKLGMKNHQKQQQSFKPTRGSPVDRPSEVPTVESAWCTPRLHGALMPLKVSEMRSSPPDTRSRARRRERSWGVAPASSVLRDETGSEWMELVSPWLEIDGDNSADSDSESEAKRRGRIRGIPAKSEVWTV